MLVHTSLDPYQSLDNVVEDPSISARDNCKVLFGTNFQHEHCVARAVCQT